MEALIITIVTLALLSMGIGFASDYSNAKTSGGKTRRKKH